MYNRHRKSLNCCRDCKYPANAKNRRKMSGSSNICKVTIFLSSTVLSNSRIMFFIKLMIITKTYCPELHLVRCKFNGFQFLQLAFTDSLGWVLPVILNYIKVTSHFCKKKKKLTFSLLGQHPGLVPFYCRKSSSVLKLIQNITTLIH